MASSSELAARRQRSQPLPASRSQRRPLPMHPFVFVAPSLLLLVLLLVLPLGQAIVTSLTVKGAFSFDNYARALGRDDLVRLALGHTLVFAAVSTVGQYILGLLIALFLHERIPARGLFRVLFLIPWMFPAVVPGIVWRWMLDGQFGIVNELLLRVGLIHSYVAWLGTPDTALPATIVANIWRGFPFMLVMLLAALQVIPGELYEAASVDGARWFHRFWHITLPSIRDISLVVVLLGWIGSFMNFAIVQVMTNGGPANASEVLATQIYKSAFQYFDLSYAAAIGVLLLVFLSLPGAVYARMTLRPSA
jgi:multiple sugar transport system permease protein